MKNVIQVWWVMMQLDLSVFISRHMARLSNQTVGSYCITMVSTLVLLFSLCLIDVFSVWIWRHPRHLMRPMSPLQWLVRLVIVTFPFLDAHASVLIRTMIISAWPSILALHSTVFFFFFNKKVTYSLSWHNALWVANDCVMWVVATHYIGRVLSAWSL